MALDETIETIPRPKSVDPLLEGLLVLCGLNDRAATASALTAGLPLAKGHLTLSLMRRAGARADLDVEVRQRALEAIPESLLPVLLVLEDGSARILTGIDGEDCTVILPEMPRSPQTIPLARLRGQYSGTVVFAAPAERHDSRSGNYAADPARHWFWGELRAHAGDFGEVAFAAALANILAIASSLFAMQVYDRVVPNLAFATLWVLTAGVGLAILIEALVRVTRSYLMDVTGRKLDLKLSSRVFEQALGMRLEARPRSIGSFASQVRELEAVREFFTSTTIGALSDIPFALVFIGVIALIGGPVAWVLVAAVPLIVLPGLLAQWPLARLSRRHLREGAVRNGLLMEAVSGAETLKSIEGESRFQRIWEEYTGLLAANSTRMRTLSGTLTFSATAVQQASYVMVMVVGVYQIAAGKMTVGALLACAILSSRTIAPLTQMSQIFARWQHMRAALVGLEGIMKSPVDRPPERRFVHRPWLDGEYRLEDVAFAYDAERGAAFTAQNLTLKAGGATALLGTNGSGKTTLLKLLAGLYHPSQGQLLLDGTDIRQIDPADIRKAVGYLPQDVRLFYGTLRENLTMGAEDCSEEEILEALRFVGAERLVQEHPLGLDRMIGEGGSGVSGGQRQSIGLARLWLRDPRIVLLDEPTAAMDHALELKVIANMQDWLAGRTLVVATHRQPVLRLAQRALVVKNGRAVADGPVEDVLAALSPSGGKAAKKGASL